MGRCCCGPHSTNGKSLCFYVAMYHVRGAPQFCVCWKFWIILTHQSYRRNSHCPGEVAAVVIHNKRCQREVQEKDMRGVGGRQGGGGGEGRNEEQGRGGRLGAFSPDISPTLCRELPLELVRSQNLYKWRDFRREGKCNSSF